MLYRITAVEPRQGYRLWLRFEDGMEGELSVSHLVGRGVFKAWEDEQVFRKVAIDPELGTVTWPGGLDLAPDNLYRRLTEARSAMSSSA